MIAARAVTPWCALRAAVPLLALCYGLAGAGTDLSAPGVEPGACAPCHAQAVTEWQGSHHARAMLPATPSSVLGDFANRHFRDRDTDTRFTAVNGAYQLSTEGPDGRIHAWPVLYTFGVYPLQQYLVETAPGRLQAYPVAWDARPRKEGGQRWFNLYPGQHLQPGDPLHWTGHLQNWNRMCADCHSTGVQSHQDPESGAFSTTAQHVAVACAACHGDASRHLDWTRAPQSGPLPNHGFRQALGSPGGHWSAYDPRGIRRWEGPARSDPDLQACAGCHMRRRPLVAGTADQSFLDRFRPALIEPGLYFADGQIDGEVFETGSFLQSRMHAAGVRCGDCHAPHSGQLRRTGNALCTGCHRADTFDRPAHHHHRSGQTASACTACHMPSRTYMQIHVRHDHAFRVPRPALSAAVGAPDACTTCHTGRSAAWAQQQLAQWRQDTLRSSDAATLALAAGWRDPVEAAPRLHALASDTSQPAIRRASAMECLARSGIDPGPGLVAWLTADDAWLRLGSLSLTAVLPAAQRQALLAPLLGDAVRAVRIEAGRMLPDVPSAALEEWIAAEQLGGRAPDAQVNLAALYASQQRWREAEQALRVALHEDPRHLPALLDLADLDRSTGRDAEAGPWLQQATQWHPQDATAQFAQALWLVRQDQREAAGRALQRASELDPGDRAITEALRLFATEHQPGSPGPVTDRPR